MKRRFTLLAAVALGLTMLSPALADGWYEHHDHDHDGRWSYNEFRDAHHSWYNDHHEGRAYSDRQLERHFNRRDHDHDGYVSREEIQRFHRW